MGAEEKKGPLAVVAEQLAKPVYKDVGQGAAREVGKSLAVVGSFVRLAVRPMQSFALAGHLAFDWLDDALRKKFEGVPEEKIIEPRANVAGPLMLAAGFTSEDQPELRELYAQLLATAMHADTRDAAHPAFVETVRQLSPDEALLLEHLRLESKNFAIQETWENDHCIDGDSIPVQFQALCERAGVSNTSLSYVYLENLMRLGILREALYTEGRYLPAGHNRHGTYEASIANGGTRIVEIGEFGERFMAACVCTVTRKPTC
ncbi:MAG: DUF4393 domain-containing protein [Myxococcales bacterium]